MQMVELWLIMTIDENPNVKKATDRSANRFLPRKHSYTPF